jgi:hypothetical protein
MAKEWRGKLPPTVSQVLSQRCTVVQSTVVWAVRLSIGNTRFRPACGTKTRQPIKTKFGREDYVGDDIRSRKKIGGRLSGGAPTQWPMSNFCDFLLPLFSRTSLQVRRIFRLPRIMHQTTWFRWYTCLLGEKVEKFHILGSPAPKTTKISPQTGKSHLNLKCLKTFKR